jgi:hypothetical protein
MRYTVTAADEVLDKLALIWMQAPDAEAVRRASHEIDVMLRNAPLSRGQDHGTYRTLTVDPLTVVYTVSPPDCHVEILDFISHG